MIQVLPYQSIREQLYALQVLWPQILTLAIMIFSIALTLEQQLSGNFFMTAILSSQIILNIVNATIVGGVYELTSWLPAVYLQVQESAPCLLLCRLRRPIPVLSTLIGASRFFKESF